MEWAEFTLALAAFLASHVIPARLRGPLVARFGRRAYVAGYSLLSLGLLYWLILAAGRAPFVEVWPQLPWMRWLVNLAMPLAILLAVAGGMRGLMAGFAVWAGAHLVANGELAHVILFGAMLAFALAGVAAAEARARRMPDFARLAAHTSVVPGVALLAGRWRPRGWPSPARLALAAAIWAALLWLHPPVIGAVALP